MNLNTIYKWSYNLLLQVEFYMKHAKILTEVKNLLTSKVGKEDSSEGLVMVDSMQRLGIDHHFQKEIEFFLESQHMAMMMMDTGAHKYSLHEVALSFRLLRQQGHFVLAGAFSSYSC